MYGCALTSLQLCERTHVYDGSYHRFYIVHLSLLIENVYSFRFNWIWVNDSLLFLIFLSLPPFSLHFTCMCNVYVPLGNGNFRYYLLREYASAKCAASNTMSVITENVHEIFCCFVVLLLFAPLQLIVAVVVNQYAQFNQWFAWEEYPTYIQVCLHIEKNKIDNNFIVGASCVIKSSSNNLAWK